MGKNITEEIEKLKKERNAIILAHYYQPDEIQEIADYVGDSYYLSEIARDSVENIIVFCGVKFMGESAKILSPNKTILMPSLDSGCAMADMINEGDIIEFKNKYKDAYTVCYINSSATVKAHCDVSVTSSSALDILNSIENKQILFLPDRNLGEYIAENFKEKEFILWDGCCKYHNNIKINEIYELKEKYPNSKILVHPECQKQIRDIADYIGSTAGIINYATNNDYKDYIIATEEGILYELKKKNPDKNFYIPGGSISCVDMKKTTLNNLYDTLLNMKNEVILDESVSKNALKCLENMHSLAK